MRFFPAIDLFEGKVVRLSKGDFSRVKEYGVRPLDAAKAFLDKGCSSIHVVDLEGAKAGEPRSLAAAEKIAGLGMFLQYGGGLRSFQSVKSALDAGADRVMVGSLVFRSKESAAELFARFGDGVMPAVDIRGGEVLSSGWLKSTGLSPESALRELKAAGFKSFLITDTERDGMLSGCRADMYREFVRLGIDVTAAGGIGSARDIADLRRAGVGGAVAGKSLYEGKLTIEDALAAAKGI
jgi:phosphoribosylformimino-5-aminoimidazole carboxamide ribotide isomerase